MPIKINLPPDQLSDEALLREAQEAVAFILLNSLTLVHDRAMPAMTIDQATLLANDLIRLLFLPTGKKAMRLWLEWVMRDTHTP